MAKSSTSTFVFLTLSTGMTLVRQIADPETEYVNGRLAGASRIIIGGVLVTGLFLVAEEFIPQFTKPLAGLVFITATLVHGVALGEALVNATNLNRPIRPTDTTVTA